MQECKRHALESQPGGGVCARCLEERLLRLWKGESFRQSFREHYAERVRAAASGSSAAAASVGVAEEQLNPGRRSGRRSHNPESAHSGATSSQEAAASVRKQLQVHGVARPPSDHARTRVGVSSGVANGDDVGRNAERLGGGEGEDPGSGASTLVRNSKDIMEEWAEFQARRRRGNLGSGAGLGELDSSPSKSRGSIELGEANPAGDAAMDVENVRRVTRAPPNPDLVILMNAQKLRSQAMILDDRSAEDTALRVINEQADHLFFDELDAYGAAEDVIPERDGCGEEALRDGLAAQRCFSPRWQSRKSPKWVKVLVSSMASRNRVFPSRSKEDAGKGRGSRKRGARSAPSDSSGKVDAQGGMSPQRTRGSSRGAEEMRSSSVFSWLQVAGTKDYKQDDHGEQQLRSSSSSSLTNSVSTDSWLQDLTTVGHLHEIAEEMEIVEESSEGEDDLGDVSSFGKFLLLASQRQPQARLTRLVSAGSN